MAFNGLINVFILNQLENADLEHREKVERRVLRENSDPFSMCDRSFVETYRLTKDLVHCLITEVGPHMKQAERVTAVPINLKVFAALYFFAHGNYQKCVGNNFQMGLKQPTVSIILTEVTEVMVGQLLDRWVVFPKRERELRSAQQKFLEKSRLPGVIGAIDCTHIAVIAPPVEHPTHPAHAYYNRKGYYSLNVQMVCDYNLKILNCNARFPGSSHDSGIWALSAVKRHLQTEFVGGRLRSSWLVGDAGYPLQPWLLTPIENAEVNSPQSRYTEAHIKARNCIERCFGVLKSRFRCLLKHRTLNYDPVKAAKIVYSCVILHNMAVETKIPQEILEEFEEEEEEAAALQRDRIIEPQNDFIADENWLAEGRRIRNIAIQNFR